MSPLTLVNEMSHLQPRSPAGHQVYSYPRYSRLQSHLPWVESQWYLRLLKDLYLCVLREMEDLETVLGETGGEKRTWLFVESGSLDLAVVKEAAVDGGEETAKIAAGGVGCVDGKG